MTTPKYLLDLAEMYPDAARKLEQANESRKDAARTVRFLIDPYIAEGICLGPMRATHADDSIAAMRANGTAFAYDGTPMDFDGIADCVRDLGIVYPSTDVVVHSIATRLSKYYDYLSDGCREAMKEAR